MLFRETIVVYCKNHMKHINALYGNNAELWCVKASGTYRNHWALKGQHNDIQKGGSDTFLEDLTRQADL
jgi:hypothetical protein